MAFAEKLDWLKNTLQVTDAELGEALNTHGSAVCHMRKGRRKMDPEKHRASLETLVEFAFRRAKALHINALDAYDTESLIAYLFEDNSSGQSCWFGLEGILFALARLRASQGITVYLSLEHARILRESDIAFWQKVCSVNGNKALLLVFDAWHDADEAEKTLRNLLPYVRMGLLNTHIVQSTQKYFYSDITFFSTVGIVIAAEPVPGAGCVVIPVQSPEYLMTMGAALEKISLQAEVTELDENAILRQINRAQKLEGAAEQLARAIHADYLAKMRASGNTKHPSVVEWDELSEEFRESNRAQARSISEKLNMVGFTYDAGDTPFPSVEKFDEETTLLLAQSEHIRWMQEKLANGWTYAPVRDNGLKHHPCLVPYDDLPVEEQQKDIDVVLNMIPLLKSIGLRVYRTI
ncbi:MAG: RyR domain-containing protein [Oscillospiraceae bacterium]|nr:RyR domain-containing protein [Oscillospiraceae bacterium]